MKAGRYLYEKSISYQGHLVIPFVRSRVNRQPIYSYALLSEIGHKGLFHQSENPTQLYSCHLNRVFEIAKKHLENYFGVVKSPHDYFQHRYTYCKNLIIVHQELGKFFYDHYLPDVLNNIAAPKIFESEAECLLWVQQGIDRHTISFASDRN
ncbi:hypothetical protein Pse7367_1876 [Thalassoporum mexicanum PCC 7367]|uniref:hypothetical protein n=1 Tax=Thalassoporum mexicanum TaxID=3457544 RepID=UPI0002A000BD|nr:hypothetical protein [Pseudanabaena sp. PCC 7367]AFY70152.1 hypothetical protein Pse7367_1876 [Pseudanabaena sp. PCC 7367]